jgi:hypothetical protein
MQVWQAFEACQTWTSRTPTMHPQVQIRVKGQISECWSEWLDGLRIAHTDQDETVLSGEVADQAALYGLIAKLRDLGLPLLAVNLVEGVSNERQ